MGIADIAIGHVDAGARDAAIFQQLEEDIGIGDLQDRPFEVDGGIAHELGDIGGPGIPAEGDLEAQDVAIEGDGAVEIADGEAGVMGLGDLGQACLLLL